MKKTLLLILSALFIFDGYTQPSNTWTQKADFNADPVGWERAYAVGFSINGKGYIGTGSGYLNDFWEYDPVTNVWTQKANVGGMGRREAVGFSINGKGYIGTGFGYNGSFSFLNDFWEYDPNANVWTQKTNFGGAARVGAIGFSVNGKGYIGTGYNGSYYKDFWEYDPTTNLWTRKADFPGTARDEAVGFSINGKGYLGTGGDASFNYNDFWQYDPSTNSWLQKAYLPSYSRAGAVGFSINNKGYIGTGYVVGLGARKDFWEYDPSTNLWAQKADFSGAARYFAVGFNINSKGYIGTGSLRDFWEYTPVSDNTITINPQISTTFCQTDGFGLAYSVTGQYSSDNIFTAQLSDVNGNFANPVNIGTNISTSSGTIQCDFNYPPPGTHYRIRVIASAPSTIGSDNGMDLEIKQNHTYYRDADGDGFGNPDQYVEICAQLPGYVTNNTDCDDSKLLYADNDGDGFGAGSPVACGVDNNTDCNDADATVHSPQTYYADNDGDGFGDPNNSISECTSTPPSGYVTDNTDCDDAKTLYADNDGDGYGAGSPVACGVVDNTDCNDADVTVHSPQTYYADNDGDGFGDPNNSISECSSTPPSGYVTDNTDCDDSKLLYADNDGDGYGAGSPVACGVDNNTDCNDADVTVHSQQTYYADNDGDGFGDPNNSISACSSTPPSGYVTGNSDCDDTKTLYADSDGDGFGAGSPVACGVVDNTDCNDADASVHSPQTYYADNDGDGFGDANNSISECSSTSPSGYVTDNSDCDDTKTLYADNDGDGYGAGSPVACGVDNNTDCNDADATVHSPQTYYADNDGDGFGDPNNSISECSSTPPSGYVTDNSDCNDNSSSVHPGAIEICGNAIDDDCDGSIDEDCNVPVTISIADASVVEGNNGTRLMKFLVTLSAPVNDKVRVTVATQNGTATAGSDYLSAFGVLTFKKGVTQKLVKVPVLGDKNPESNETFTVQLSNPVNISIADGTATGTIIDNDASGLANPPSTITKNNTPQSNYAARIYPNPVRDLLTVQLTGVSENEVTLQLQDIQGRVLRQEKVKPFSKLAQQKINVSGLANGVYLLVVIDKNGIKQTEKVMVQK